MADLLSEAEILEHLAAVPDWTRDGGSIRREYRFKGFGAAFGFMTRAALAAERLNHHPDWSNTYNRVAVRLTTHDKGGLTTLDFELAQRMDAAASGAGQAGGSP